MSIELGNVGSGFNRSVINANFDLIQTFLNDVALKRETTSQGEANEMRAHLDMNFQAIVNMLADVNDPSSALTVGDGDARYVNVSGDEMVGPLSGVEATTPTHLIPAGQVGTIIDDKLGTFDPNSFLDYGLITGVVTDTNDYGAL